MCLFPLFQVYNPTPPSSETGVKLRLGKGEKFQNIQKSQVHAVATAAQEESDGSVHENVIGFDSSEMEKSLTHTIDKVEFPSCTI